MDEIVEIKNRRSLNSKHFLIGDGKSRGKFYGNSIHYFNKLGLGDSLNDFREIDFSLSFDEVKRGWKFEYNNFHPFLPEYADDFGSFRDVFDNKDRVIRFRPKNAGHILGRLVDPTKEGLENISSENFVIYDNALGKGIDLIYCFRADSLQKLVRIREKENKDYTFDFEIEIPNEKTYRANSKIDVIESKNGAYELDKTRNKILDTNKSILIGEDDGSGKEWATYMFPFRVWDSGELSKKQYSNIVVDFYVENEKTYIRKNIPQSFIEKSLGDVFCDTTYSSNSYSDDAIYQNSSVWATVRNATSGDLRADSYGLIRGQLRFATLYDIERFFFTFDTSSIPDDNIISAASLDCKSSGASGSNPDHTVSAYDSAHSDIVTGTDFDLRGSTLYSSNSNAFSAWGAAGTAKSWTFNATGIAGISKTAKTKFCLLDDTTDVANSTPASVLDYSNGIYSKGNATAGNRPFLNITYAPPVVGPANLKSWNGLAKASIKSINSVLIANVKSVNGLA